VKEEILIKKEFVKLNKVYANQIKEVSKTSDNMFNLLDTYYTAGKIKTFKTFDSFLGDINYILSTHCSAKVLFVNYIKNKYF